MTSGSGLAVQIPAEELDIGTLTNRLVAASLIDRRQPPLSQPRMRISRERWTEWQRNFEWTDEQMEFVCEVI